MSFYIVHAFPNDFTMSLARKTCYGIATACILGTAVYVGYRVATSDKQLDYQSRQPELNDRVSDYYNKKISTIEQQDW